MSSVGTVLRTVHVVMGSQGSYSDRQVWAVAAFGVYAAAEEFVIKSDEIENQKYREDYMYERAEFSIEEVDLK